MWKIILGALGGFGCGYFVCAQLACWFVDTKMVSRAEIDAYARLLREFVAAYTDKNLLGIMGVYHDACKILRQ